MADICKKGPIAFINPFKVDICINDVSCAAMVDSGSSASVLPEKVFKKSFESVILSPDNRVISGYDGFPLKIVGKA